MTKKMRKVRLLVAHTGIGKPGAEVDMEEGKAKAHEAAGLVETLDPRLRAAEQAEAEAEVATTKAVTARKTAQAKRAAASQPAEAEAEQAPAAGKRRTSTK